MLMITNAQPSKTITQDKMMQIYDVPNIITKRFDDLVYGGYYQKFGDQYTLTSKGKIVLSIYDFAINTLHLNQSLKESINAKE